MRVLVLSNTAWNNNNSFGNSFSNIFEGLENVDIANIFCRQEKPKNNVVSRYFQITEKALLKNLCNKNHPSGKVVYVDNAEEMTDNEIKAFDYARKKRWRVMFWLRDMIWKVGRWKSYELKTFIDDFNPDLLFMPIYYSSYLNDILVFIKEYTNKPMLGYISDDCYTLRQFSLSPFYWIDRLYKRRKVKKSIDMCEILYVISDIQKKEYDKCFNKDCKILWKINDFDEQPVYEEHSDIIKLVYTGNIGTGRYKQLSLIGKQLAEINKDKKIMELDIYTQTPLSKKMQKALDLPGINMKGGIPVSEVDSVQNSADILVHVESFDLKDRLAVHQSFSTKIVDYLYKGKCILAVGPHDVASIDYLKKNDAALVAVNSEELKTVLERAANNKDLLWEYGKKAWDCGKKNHQRKDIQARLKQDFEFFVKE